MEMFVNIFILRKLQNIYTVYIQTINGLLQYSSIQYLPGCKTGSAHKVTTGFDLHIFVIFSTDLTKLKGGTHFTVQLILLLLRQSKFLLVIKRGIYQTKAENKNTNIPTKTHILLSDFMLFERNFHL